MCKVLYWIDDDIENILDLERYIFPVFWGLGQAEHIINKIILFGDDLKKGLESNVMTDKRERNIIHRMVSNFKEACDKEEQANPNHTLFEEKKYLVENIFRLFAKIPTGVMEKDELEKQKEIIELTNRIIDFWNHKEKIINEDEYKRNQDDIDKLIEEFDISEDAFVAIDLVLLYQDDKRVKEGSRILSMELYNKLSNKCKGKCFIYSRYISDIQLAKKWQEIYKEKYDLNADIKLYKRKDFNTEESTGTLLLNKIRNEIIGGKENAID